MMKYDEIRIKEMATVFQQQRNFYHMSTMIETYQLKTNYSDDENNSSSTINEIHSRLCVESTL